MLNAGFDDVFDIAKTPPPEACARAAAITREYAITRHAHSSVGQMALALEPICNPASLTPREFALLWLMVSNQGRPVPAAQMARQIAHIDPAQFRRSIKVSMSNLRRKFLPDWRIESDLQGGYGLYSVEIANDADGIRSSAN
jgi:DNA-binding response OmpR family regulator